MIAEPTCHCCGSPKVAYANTITQLGPIPVMVNIYYCKHCARLVDQFEQWLFRTYKENTDRDVHPEGCE